MKNKVVAIIGAGGEVSKAEIISRLMRSGLEVIIVSDDDHDIIPDRTVVQKGTDLIKLAESVHKDIHKKKGKSKFF